MSEKKDTETTDTPAVEPVPFVHLHDHSEFSSLDGGSRISKMPEILKEKGMTAMGLTDHGVMQGLPEFHDTLKKQGIKPILGCLPAGHMIETPSGAKPIEAIEAGDLVFTHRGRVRRVTGTMRRPHKGLVYSLSVSRGTSRVWVTEEHPVLIKRRGVDKPEWVRADQLNGGRPGVKPGVNNWREYAVVPKGRPEHLVTSMDVVQALDDRYGVDADGSLIRFGLSKWESRSTRMIEPTELAVTEQLGRLLGLFAAEGSFQHNAHGPTAAIWTFHENESHLADEVVASLHDIFGVPATIRHRPEKTIREVLCSRTVVARWLASQCGTGAKSKRVPESVFSFPDAPARAFLDAVMEGDGGLKPTGRWVFKVASRDLAYGVRRLLTRWGHFSSITESFRTVDGGLRTSYELSWADKSEFKHSLQDDANIYVPLRGVETKEFDGYVYNFEVEEDHSYLSGISLHNCEIYLTGDRHNHNQRETPTWHLTLLAETNAGYQNLCKISSWSFIEGRITTFGRARARADWELLGRYSEGIICLTGCMAGPVMSELMQSGELSLARKRTERLIEIFGAENVYGEIQNVGIMTGIPADSEVAKVLGKAPLSGSEIAGYKGPGGEPADEVQPGQVPITQTEANRVLVEEICKPLGLRYVATGDVHYLREEDAEPHDIMLCIGTGQLKKGPRRFSLLPKKYHLRSYEEMQAAIPEYPEALTETVSIAERCSAEIAYGKELLPRFPIPEDFADSGVYLRSLCEEGLEDLYPEGDEYREQAVERLEMELGVIGSMGFNDYFLIVWDLFREARARNIPYGPGRGSAAGAIVAYTLGITQVDPLREDLLFERFLNPDRVSMPDIDMDFGVALNKDGIPKRDELIEYAKEKYNSLAGCDTAVTMIATFSKFKGKGALKDSARVLADPTDEGKAMGIKVGNKLASYIPNDPRATMRSVWLDQDQGRQLRAAHAGGGFEAEVIEQAGWMEGLVKTYGTHAAGVIIGDHDLTDDLPLQQMKADKAFEVQYDMGTSEKIGLLKMDFLGLRNLDVIWDAIEKIKYVRGVDVGNPWRDIPLDDKKTYELLARGESIGVFQYESSGMVTTMRQIRPTEFSDLVAIVALYRPGAMTHIPTYADRKNGRQKVTYLDPRLEEIQGETYGITIYQEQSMLIARMLAGFTPGQADDLRKAIGKKLKDKMESLRPIYMEGCKKNGVPAEVAKDLWADNEAAADYSFNKAHADAYALISYVTAYLKANYPEEYHAALLSSVMGKKDKPRLYLTEAKRMGIPVLPPDINRSLKDFAVLQSEEEPGQLEMLFGLNAIRGVGEKVVAEIKTERDTRGPFKSMFDLIRRMPGLNKTVLSALIRGGALDTLGPSRKGMDDEVEPAIDRIKKQRKAEEKAQFEKVRGFIEANARPGDETDKKGRRKLDAMEKEGIKGGALFALNFEGFPGASQLEDPVYEALLKKETQTTRADIRKALKETSEPQMILGMGQEESADGMSEKAKIETAAKEKVTVRIPALREQAVELAAQVDVALKAVADREAEEMGLAAAVATETDPPLGHVEWPELEKLNLEREKLGIYVTGHPLDRDTRKWAHYVDKGLGQINDSDIDATLKVVGALVGKQPITTRRGEKMYKLTFEDLTGSKEVTVFPSTLEGIEEMLEIGTVLALDVRVEEDTFAAAKKAEEAEAEDGAGEVEPDEEGKPVQLVAGRVYNWDPSKLAEPKRKPRKAEAEAQAAAGSSSLLYGADDATAGETGAVTEAVVEPEVVTFELKTEELTPEFVRRLQGVCADHPGESPLRLLVDGEKAMATEIKVEACPELQQSLQALHSAEQLAAV